MKTPHPRQFAEYMRRLPRWVVPLILVLLVGRFVILLLFHLFATPPP